MLTRILTAVVLIPLVLAALFLLAPRAWAVVTLAVIAIAANEWARLTGMSGSGRIAFIVVTVVIGALLLFVPAFGFADGWPRTVVMVICGIATAFWLVIVPLWLRARWRVPSPWLGAVVGILVLVATWVAIVSLQAQSAWRVLAAMAVVWIADTFAYFAGRAFGRHKLAPAISPGKTWEGVAGALVAVAIYAALVLHFVGGDVPGLPGGIVGGVLLVVAVAALSVCGDLFESLLKRQAGVKDSGHILPGHGGVLDRIDALLAAMPPLAIASLLVPA